MIFQSVNQNLIKYLSIQMFLEHFSLSKLQAVRQRVCYLPVATLFASIGRWVPQCLPLWTVSTQFDSQYHLVSMAGAQFEVDYHLMSMVGTQFSSEYQIVL